MPSSLHNTRFILLISFKAKWSACVGTGYNILCCPEVDGQMSIAEKLIFY